MNCEAIKSLVTSHLAGELSQSEALDFNNHMIQCRECRDELAALCKVWEVMGEWQDFEPGADLGNSVLTRIKEEAGQSSNWLGSRVGLVLFSALAASLLSVGSSVALHYGKAVKLSRLALQELGTLGYLPDSAIFFLVGCLYGLLPLLVVGLIVGRMAEGGLRLCSGVVAVFLLITLPYVAIECRTFGLGFALSLLSGLAIGAFSGSVGGFYLGSRRATLVGQH